ncbi:uncharacterized protein LOC111903647 [Lactuca sativa]|uniref:uncharacterized protein LOC111903647 n=1 Tax=Lactuca sativa TaxID=4236 RepID=UPI000CD7FC01|nr:uncharacterized protein LOC111903647 [Lactuca sativa]
MNKDHIEQYHKRALREKYNVVKSLLESKKKDGEFVSIYVQRIQQYVDLLVWLKLHFDEELDIDIILNSLPSFFDQFILTYHLNKNETTLAHLHNLVRTNEARMKGKSIASTPASAPVLAIGQGKGENRKRP